jgi:hypothetical protein
MKMASAPSASGAEARDNAGRVAGEDGGPDSNPWDDDRADDVGWDAAYDTNEPRQQALFLRELQVAQPRRGPHRHPAPPFAFRVGILHVNENGVRPSSRPAITA